MAKRRRRIVGVEKRYMVGGMMRIGRVASVLREMSEEVLLDGGTRLLIDDRILHKTTGAINPCFSPMAILCPGKKKSIEIKRAYGKLDRDLS
jgi:hypothetical protein